MRGNAPQVVEALWAAKEEPPAKLVGFSFVSSGNLAERKDRRKEGNEYAAIGKAGGNLPALFRKEPIRGGLPIRRH